MQKTDQPNRVFWIAKENIEPIEKQTDTQQMMRNDCRPYLTRQIIGQNGSWKTMGHFSGEAAVSHSVLCYRKGFRVFKFQNCKWGVGM